MARPEAVAVENARNDIVSRDQRQRAHRGDDVGGCAGALSSAAARQPIFGVGAADPMQGQHDLGRSVVEIGDGLMDQGAYDALLEPRVCCRGRPDSLEIVGERAERSRSQGRLRRCCIMVGDTTLARGHTGQGTIPPCLELASDEAVLGISRIILPERTFGRIARRLQIADQRLTRFVAPGGRLHLGGMRRLNCSWLHDAEQCRLDHVINAQSAKRNAVGFAIVEASAHAGVARDLPFGSGILDGQLAAATATTEKARQKRRTEFGCPREPTGTFSLTILRIASARSQST